MAYIIDNIQKYAIYDVMKIAKEMSDGQIIHELGSRLAATRLELNRSQEDIATEAGIGLRTLQRLEKGEGAVQLSTFTRVCRELGLLERIDTMIPETKPSPVAMMRYEKGKRKYASHRKGPKAKSSIGWSWSE